MRPSLFPSYLLHYRNETKTRYLQKLERGEPIDDYADIKANLLVTVGRKSMVCELQFLLKTMINAKKQTHPFYEIKRTHASRQNVAKVRNLYESPTEELLAIAMRQNEKELARFMLKHRSFDYFGKHTANGSSLIHYLSKGTSVKMMKILLSTLAKDVLLENILTMKSPPYDKTPIHFAVSAGHLDMVKASIYSFHFPCFLFFS